MRKNKSFSDGVLEIRPGGKAVLYDSEGKVQSQTQLKVGAGIHVPAVAGCRLLCPLAALLVAATCRMAFHSYSPPRVPTKNRSCVQGVNCDRMGEGSEVLVGGWEGEQT